MFKLTLTLVLAALACVSAYCPNSCSGHGACGPSDKCTCYLKAGGEQYAWTGPDCSQRTCPSGEAWATTAVATNQAHPVVECSEKGICDRGTGVCDCFAGYEGVACERSVCPDDCSKNGFCYTQKQIVDSVVPAGYANAWDAKKHVGCICDKGFRGANCKQRECPSGEDSMGGPDQAEFRDCSGRGLCNYDNGLCECFMGFYGSMCENQTVLS